MRGDKVRTRGGGVQTKGGWVRIRGGGVWTKGGGVRTRGRGVRTCGRHISYNPRFFIDDPLLDFSSSSSLQHTTFTFSTPLDQSLPPLSVPSIDEGMIQEDVRTSFILELLVMNLIFIYLCRLVSRCHLLHLQHHSLLCHHNH